MVFISSGRTHSTIARISARGVKYCPAPHQKYSSPEHRQRFGQFAQTVVRKLKPAPHAQLLWRRQVSTLSVNEAQETLDRLMWTISCPYSVRHIQFSIPRCNDEPKTKTETIKSKYMRYTSPLRYPGGKASLTGFLTDVIDMNNLRGCVYYEPYAGGAGAALTLLRNDIVSEIYINDADERIHAFWQSGLNASERFIGKILSVPLTINEWHRQNEICLNPSRHEPFDVGFAAFFMNRCNRSGVLTGAGPIGGFEQTGKWRMGVRFNREELAARISFLSRLKGRIRVSGLDAIDFLQSRLPRGRGRAKVFVYLDPPYVNNGQRLYLNAYKPKDHARLTSYLAVQTTLPWIVSYDDTALVRDLYASYQISLLPIHYTLQEKRSTRELIIAPHRVAMPSVCRIHGQESLIQSTINTGAH